MRSASAALSTGSVVNKNHSSRSARGSFLADMHDRRLNGLLALRRQLDLEVAQFDRGLALRPHGPRGLLACLYARAQTLDLDNSLALRWAFPHLVEQLVGVVLAENPVRLRPH